MTANPLDPSAEYWVGGEPVWEPERLVALLVPGTMVRVRVSAECSLRSLHLEHEAIGKITVVFDDWVLKGHRFYVEQWHGRGPLTGLHAAIELEPIKDEPYEFSGMDVGTDEGSRTVVVELSPLP